MRQHKAGVRALAMVFVALALGIAAAPAGAAAPTQDVLFVGNNWDGTADVIDPQSFTRIGRINIVPDRAERMAEIQRDPAALGYFLAIRQLIGEGHTSSSTTCSARRTASACTCRGRASRTWWL
jgi:hypothetical protein